MPTIPNLNDSQAVVEIQKVMDELALKGNTKSRIASILNYLNLKTGSSWSLSGNNILISNYLGSTNNVDLRLIRNAQVYISLLTGGITHLSGKLGINTPTPEAALEIKSTTDGFLIPRLNQTQINAIATPAQSLMLYNTSLNQYQYYRIDKWVPFLTDRTEIGFSADGTLDNGFFVPVDQVKNLIFNELQFGYEIDAVSKTILINTKESTAPLDFVPLPGTEVGEPITGPLEFSQDLHGQGMYQYFDNAFSGFFFYQDEGIGLYFDKDNTNLSRVSLTVGSERIYIDGVKTDFKGLQGSRYFGDNYDANTYIQKQYVDENISSLTLEQARLNGNVLEGDVEINSDTNFNIFQENSNYYKYISFSDDVSFVLGIIDKKTGYNSELEISTSNLTLGGNSPDFKGILGKQEFNKQGDRLAFAQLSDVYDIFNTPVSSTAYGIVNNVALQELGGVDKKINGIRIGKGSNNIISNSLFGNNSLVSNTNGYNNAVFGNNNLTLNTTGYANSTFGKGTLEKLTTGQYNVAFGFEAARLSVTGYKNTFLGAWSGEWSEGNYNVMLGYSANGISRLGNYPVGNRNIMIGAFSGQNISGNNNVFIGAFAGRSPNNFIANLNNKLVIHSHTGFTGASGDSDGDNLTYESTLANALLTGDFLEKWIKINGSFIINPTYLVDSDAPYYDYPYDIVSKLDGTFGRKTRLNLNSHGDEKNTGIKWSNGKAIYSTRITYISAGSPGAPSTDIFFHTVPGAEEIIKIENGFCKFAGDTKKYPKGCFLTDEANWCDYYDANNLFIKFKVGGTSERTFICDIYYTKP